MSYIYTNGLYVPVPVQVSSGTGGEWFTAVCAFGCMIFVWVSVARYFSQPGQRPAELLDRLFRSMGS